MINKIKQRIILDKTLGALRMSSNDISLMESSFEKFKKEQNINLTFQDFRRLGNVVFAKMIQDGNQLQILFEEKKLQIISKRK